ncbi:MAG: hypothetical protein ACJ8AM_10825 [Gemmatimonadales bacterium]
MTRADFMALKQAVEELHRCEANYISSEHVRESLGDTLVFDGAVSLFGLSGHPAATMCYAWSAQESGGPAPVVYAALRMAPIDSSRDAVRASLALKTAGVKSPY